MKILVTGFDPFGKDTINPAIEAVKKLPDMISGAEIIKLEIPTVRLQSLEKIEEAIRLHNPDVILSVGQSGGTTGIAIERVGINVDDFRIPDNAGNQVIDEPVFASGPAAYFMTIPIKAILAKILEHEIPASVSNSAGTFVCNHVAYGVRHLVETKYPGKRSGFIHIPYLPQQVAHLKNTPSMSLGTIVEALTAAIEAIAENPVDIKIGGGAIY